MFSKKSSITFLFAVSAAASVYAGPGAAIMEGLESIKGVSAKVREGGLSLRNDMKSADSVYYEESVEPKRLNPELEQGNVKPIVGLEQNHLDKTLVKFANLDSKGGISVGALEIPTGVDKITGVEKSAYSYKMDISTFDASVENTERVDVSILEGTTSQNSRNSNHRRVMARVIEKDGSVLTHTRQFNLSNPKDTQAFLGSTFSDKRITAKVDTVKSDSSILRIDIKSKTGVQIADFDFPFRNKPEIAEYISQHSGAALDSAYIETSKNITVMMKDSTGQVTAFTYRTKPKPGEKEFVRKFENIGRETSLAVNEIKGRMPLNAQSGVKGLTTAVQSAAAAEAAK